MPTVDDQRSTRRAHDDPLVPRLCRVRHVRRETHDTFTLDLTTAHANQAPPFAPGQFNMLYAFGIGEVPISISGDPADSRRLVHTIRDVGAVSRALSRLKRGGALGMRGPFGNAWPVADAAGLDVLLVAGGIGLAPLRPVVCSILAHREDYRRVSILYGARTPEDILFQRDLADWRGRFDLHVYVTVDRALGSWRGYVGVVTPLISRAPFDPANTVAMVCGPEVMMRFAVMELERAGVTAERIYVSTERNMKCGVGLCGHCQFGTAFVCKDGPVFRYDRIRPIFSKREI